MEDGWGCKISYDGYGISVWRFKECVTDVMMVGCTVLRGWVVNVWTDGIEVGIGVCWLDRVDSCHLV